MENKFKKGDFVRRKEGSKENCGLSPLDCFFVADTMRDWVIADCGTENRMHFINNVEYATLGKTNAPVPATTDSHPDVKHDSLDALIEQANVGLAALRRLDSEHGHQIAFQRRGPADSWFPWVNGTDTVGMWLVRRKPVPTLTFNIRASSTLPGELGYSVSVTPTSTQIGCQSFDSQSLFTTLRAVSDGTIADTLMNGYTVRAARTGVLWGIHCVAWSDVDKLLDRLKTVGVK